MRATRKKMVEDREQLRLKERIFYSQNRTVADGNAVELVSESVDGRQRANISQEIKAVNKNSTHIATEIDTMLPSAAAKYLRACISMSTVCAAPTSGTRGTDNRIGFTEKKYINLFTAMNKMWSKDQTSHGYHCRLRRRLALHVPSNSLPCVCVRWKLRNRSLHLRIRITSAHKRHPKTTLKLIKISMAFSVACTRVTY